MIEPAALHVAFALMLIPQSIMATVSGGKIKLNPECFFIFCFTLLFRLFLVLCLHLLAEQATSDATTQVANDTFHITL